MATCEACGNKYYTRECMECTGNIKENISQQKIYPSKQKMANKRKASRKNYNEDSEVIKIKKTNIQYVIAGVLVVIAIVLIYKEYKEYRQEQASMEMINKLGQELKPYNDSMKKSLKNLDRLNDRLYKNLNK